jgi:hypothetical protein
MNTSKRDTASRSIKAQKLPHTVGFFGGPLHTEAVINAITTIRDPLKILVNSLIRFNFKSGMHLTL